MPYREKIEGVRKQMVEMDRTFSGMVMVGSRYKQRSCGILAKDQNEIKIRIYRYDIK